MFLRICFVCFCGVKNLPKNNYGGILEGPKQKHLPNPPPPTPYLYGPERCMPSSALRFVLDSDPYFIFQVLSVLPNKFPFILT